MVVASSVDSVRLGVHHGAVPMVGGHSLDVVGDVVSTVVDVSVDTGEEVSPNQDHSVDGGTHQLTATVVGASVRFGVHQGAVPTVGGHTSVVDSIAIEDCVDEVSHEVSVHCPFHQLVS